MCILSKLNYANFGVSNLFFSKVMEEKPLGSARPPLGQEGLTLFRLAGGRGHNVPPLQVFSLLCQNGF